MPQGACSVASCLGGRKRGGEEEVGDGEDGAARIAAFRPVGEELFGGRPGGVISGSSSSSRAAASSVCSPSRRKPPGSARWSLKGSIPRLTTRAWSVWSMTVRATMSTATGMVRGEVMV